MLFLTNKTIIFVCGFSSHSRRLHYHWRATNLTCTRHSWPLSSKDERHTYFNTGYLFTWSSPWTHDTTSVAKHLAVECQYVVFTTSVCRGKHSTMQPSACEANALTDWTTAAARTTLQTGVRLILPLKFHRASRWPDMLERSPRMPKVGC